MNNSKKLLTWIGFGVSIFGMIFTFVFTIVTCANSNDFKMAPYKYKGYEVGNYPKIKQSLLIIGTIIGLIITIAGLVLAILGYEKESNLYKVTIISVCIAVFGIAYGFLATATQCSYRASLNCGTKKITDKYYSKNFKGYSKEEIKEYSKMYKKYNK